MTNKEWTREKEAVSQEELVSLTMQWHQPTMTLII